MQWSTSPVEEGLIASGFHASSEWWGETLSDVLSSNARVITIRGGRRGGKTVSVLRALLHEALCRHWEIDPGDVGIIAIVSARKPQARDRVATLRKYVEALGYEIAKPDNTERFDFVTPWGVCSVRAYAATGGDVVSGTWIGCLLDEVARWIDDRGVNPASEVIASAKPSLISTGGRMWLVSSPMGNDDAHAKAFARGGHDGHASYWAPTWVMRPSITEEECRALEPDDTLFRREYGAEPVNLGDGYWFAGAALDVATGLPFGANALTIGCGGDLAFLRDASALVVTGKDATGVIGVRAWHEWRPQKGEPLVPDDVAIEAALIARGAGATRVISDAHGRATMIHACRAVGLGYAKPPTNGAQWLTARHALLGGRVSLPPDERFVGALRRIRVRADGERVRAEHDRLDGTHGDIAVAWALAVHAAERAASGEARMLGSRAVFG
jgi:hypothetical protein